MATFDLFLPATPALRRIARDYFGALHFEGLASEWLDLKGWIVGGRDVLPLHVPAGLAIARLRLVEVLDQPNGYGEGAEAQDLVTLLRAYDPEMRDAR